jgi:putative membrane-bound dehydrogenase-like protein
LRGRGLLAIRWALLAGLLTRAHARAGEEAARLGLRSAPGFEVALYSDHDLANDLYAMTIDARGRVAVTSRGWVKVLEDSDGDGRADRASVYAETRTGGMGLCFDGADLYFTGDGCLSRYVDADGDGRADGPPERLLPLAFGEHGGHAMRKGPDGWWYVVGGNDAGITDAHASLERSPVRHPENGAILRLPPDGKGSEVVAHGFRNPYDFDFNDAGDIFTYDSDCERDFFLPWYTPTRIYHVAHGQQHGWRLNGYLRSFARRSDFPDAVEVLWPVGRGSPTGVTVYRHRRFPDHYRGGLFALDWTFGKVYFFPLAPDGATYSTRSEVFLEPVGAEGFAPVDVAVAPDGALFIAVGGRRTRGAVYRVDWMGAASAPSPRGPANEVEAVLTAPQPLDAWSRAAWMPLARKIGPEAFASAVEDGSRPQAARVRAVEVLTELFGGLPANVAKAAATASDPLVRERAAWSIGRAPREGAVSLLAVLAADVEPRVRCRALEAMADLGPGEDPVPAAHAARRNLGHPEERVRQAAARLAALLPDPAWEALGREVGEGSPRERLTFALAEIQRAPGARCHPRALEAALPVAGAAASAEERFDAVRLVVRALGDSNLESPPVEVQANYSLPLSPLLDGALAARILAVVRPLFPSGHGRLDEELGRLLAMLEDSDAATPVKVAAFLDASSPPTRDMHYLIVLSRLKAPLDRELARKVAGAIVGLDRKLQGDQARTKQTWGTRLAEVLGIFGERSPEVVADVLEHADFVRPAHVGLAMALDPERRRAAARRFLAAARADQSFEWSEALVGLLDELPPEESHPAFRAKWDDFGLRDSILLRLARKPDEADRARYLAGVESARAEVVRASLQALESLPPDGSAEGLAPLFRLLSWLSLEPREGKLRVRVAALIGRQAGRAFDVREEGTDPATLKEAYRSLFDWFTAAHPAAAANGGGAGEDVAWRSLVEGAPWDEGDAARGAAVFRARGCETCHAVQGALGPSLAGAASRFSRDDLLEAVVHPDRDVAPAYRATVFQMKDGRVFTGVVAFESADGYIVQTGATATARLANEEIEAQWSGKGSLMPSGLLKDLGPRDVADLYAYLKTLRP